MLTGDQWASVLLAGVIVYLFVRLVLLHTVLGSKKEPKEKERDINCDCPQRENTDKHEYGGFCDDCPECNHDGCVFHEGEN